MSRLLHAAARGARIQRQHFTASWEPSRLAWVGEPKDCAYEYRIHPEDEHLQYGPISSMLRELALTSEFSGDEIPYITFHIVREYVDENSAPVDCRVFLLILAESLADSGL